MAIRARTRPEPTPVEYPLISETYAVHASRPGEPMAVYLTLEPDFDRAVAKANQLWACHDISRVEVTAERRLLIGRRTK